MLKEAGANLAAASKYPQLGAPSKGAAAAAKPAAAAAKPAAAAAAKAAGSAKVAPVVLLTTKGISPAAIAGAKVTSAIDTYV